MLPQASVYPAALRATCDLLWRRTPLRRQRAERLAHVQHTNSPYNRPEIGQKIASKTPREGVAERVDEPAVQKTIEVDWALITYDAALRAALDLSIVKTAQQHDAPTFSRRRSIPGVGKILALVMLYAMHAMPRFPSVQDCVAYCRLVKCARESAGTR